MKPMPSTSPSGPAFFFNGGRAGFLLIHGLTGTPTEMRYLGLGLRRAGFTVYGMQLAGHCGTEADLLRTGWREWYESVREAAERLSREVDIMFVGGLSMGAILAMQLAAEQPGRVAGLGLYGPTLKYDGWSIPPFSRLSFLLPLVLSLGFGHGRRFIERPPYGIKDVNLRERVAGSMFAGQSAAAGLPGNPWPSLAEFYRLVRVARKNIPAIHAPALIMYAAQDDIASARNNAEFIARRLRGPVTKVLLHDSYHMITVDKERSKVIAHTVAFCNAVLEARGKLACAPAACVG